MFLNEAISKRILELCHINKITLNKLSTLAGVKQSTLNSVVKLEVSAPNVKTLYFVCFALKLELKDFFDSPLFDDLEDWSK